MIEHMRTEHRKKIKKMKKCINCETSLVDTDELYCNEAEYINASEKILHMLKCFPKNEAKTRILSYKCNWWEITISLNLLKAEWSEDCERELYRVTKWSVCMWNVQWTEYYLRDNGYVSLFWEFNSNG